MRARPARARRDQQPRLHRRGADPRRRLPRAQGQLARPALPLADRRRDGHAARAVRAGLRADRGGRPGGPDPRDHRRGGRGLPADEDGRVGRAHPAERHQPGAQADRAGVRDRGLAGAPTGRRDARRGPRRWLVRDPARARRRCGPAPRPRRGGRAGGLGAARDHQRRGGRLARAAGPGQRPRPGEDRLRLRLHVGDLHPGPQAALGTAHDADPVGRPAGRAGWTRGWTGRPARS